jgi:hypothetical protein
MERLRHANWVARVQARDVPGLPAELVARVRRLDRETLGRSNAPSSSPSASCTGYTDQSSQGVGGLVC